MEEMVNILCKDVYVIILMKSISNIFLTIQMISCIIKFQDAALFNQPIGNWNVGRVIEMREMVSIMLVLARIDVCGLRTSNSLFDYPKFENAESFNQPLGDWDVSRIQDMLDTVSAKRRWH